ncbi:MAG: metallophosphoesterase [Gemmatimonadaceae bacterium]
MRVGIIADSHDRLPAIAELMKRFNEVGIDLVLHAGDFCAPFALRPFRDAQVPLAGVFGRNDGDREGLKAEATKAVGMELYESPHSVEVSGARILLVHDIGEVQPRSLDGHAVVITGHSHTPEQSQHGSTLIINPGEACGWLYGVPSAAILDLDTLHLETIRLEGPEWRC